MSVLVMLNASLRCLISNYSPLTGILFPYSSGLTVSKLLSELNIPLDYIKIIIVNGISVHFEHLLKDDDRISFFPTIGGG